jgi:hypothetical protein
MMGRMARSYILKSKALMVEAPMKNNVWTDAAISPSVIQCVVESRTDKRRPSNSDYNVYLH